MCSPDQRVDFGHIDRVQLFDSILDLRLVGSQVADEHKRVVVLDLLHGRLSGQWVLDDGEVVQSNYVKTT